MFIHGLRHILVLLLASVSCTNYTLPYAELQHPRLSWVDEINVGERPQGPIMDIRQGSI